MNSSSKALIGEAVGTFVLVLIGCGSVAAAVVLGWLDALWQVASIWGLGVWMAILISMRWCPAHLNPAVSLAMCISGDHPWRQLIPYWLAQFIGAFLAGLLLYALMSTSIADFELSHSISRGHANSYKSAQIFGEFFPNPGYEAELQVSHIQAIAAEGIATALLLLAIYFIVSRFEHFDWRPALLIGLAVALLIMIFAPYTQCGMNPARDFGPRLVAYLQGWSWAAFPRPAYSALTVYILGPLLGASLAAFIRRLS